MYSWKNLIRSSLRPYEGSLKVSDKIPHKQINDISCYTCGFNVADREKCFVEQASILAGC